MPVRARPIDQILSPAKAGARCGALPLPEAFGSQKFRSAFGQLQLTDRHADRSSCATDRSSQPATLPVFEDLFRATGESYLKLSSMMMMMMMMMIIIIIIIITDNEAYS